jgi:hypothetical protein
MDHVNLRGNPRTAKYADKPGAYRVASRVFTDVIDPGDVLEFEIFGVRVKTLVLGKGRAISFYSDPKYAKYDSSNYGYQSTRGKCSGAEQIAHISPAG